MTRQPKRPRDANQLAKMIVDLATGAASDSRPEDDGKDPAAKAMGQRGGAARAARMTPEQRSEAARTAAKSRWNR
jgi:hypothetical protein